MRQDNVTAPGRISPSGSRKTPSAERQTPRATADVHLAPPAATEVFGNFLRTLERLDRSASRQAGKTGGNS